MLIDSFPFFNEYELVELRIRYLEEIIDVFVIVEANITHQGKKKDWNFPNVLKNNLKEFSNKIQYHQINIDPEKIKNEESWIIDNVKGDDAHRIDNFQRNYIKTACQKFSDKDILIISDVDEIPSKDKLKFINDEYNILNDQFKKNVKTDDKLNQLFKSLKEINAKLWLIEDEKRMYEKNSDFGEKFIKVSRDIHFFNDDRAKIKLEINNHTGSKIKEIKEYTAY